MCRAIRKIKEKYDITELIQDKKPAEIVEMFERTCRENQENIQKVEDPETHGHGLDDHNHEEGEGHHGDQHEEEKDEGTPGDTAGKEVGKNIGDTLFGWMKKSKDNTETKGQDLPQDQDQQAQEHENKEMDDEDKEDVQIPSN